MKTSGILRTLFIFAACACLGNATTISLTGTFRADDQIETTTFTTTGATVIRTFSYGGGTNGAQQVIAAGGFDPILNIFDSLGNQIGSFDNSAGGSPCLGGIIAGTNGCLDAYYSATLDPGTYTLTLTQFDNLLDGSLLSDGFLSSHLCSEAFCDAFDQTTARTGNWAVDITTPTVLTGTPEPATLFLTGCGLTLLFCRFRKLN